MILFEDNELAEYSLSDGCIAVPIEVFLAEGFTEPKILVYERFCTTAQTFENLYSDSPFSSNAVRFLKRKLNPLMDKQEMIASPDRCLIFEEYTAETLEQLTDLPVDQAAILLDDAKSAGMKYSTSQSPEVSDDSLASAVIVNGRIIAYAAENDYSEREDFTEIHVECAPRFRKKGYATQCVVLLAKELLKQGQKVAYIARRTNAASIRVAEKAGFSHKGTRLSLVYYRT